MTPVLCFDLETVPDVAGLRLIHGFDASVDDAEVAERAFARRREQTGSDFLPLHLHRVVAIGALLRTEDELKVRCIGEPDDPEAKLIRGFYQLVERHTPQLVSWNGGGFDLQVLHYRALVHGAQAARYWEQGDEDREFKWNNYLGRYHSRHLDLMDVLALYTPRANAPLDELARLCGFPGKLGMDGSQVWPAYRDGHLAEIRAYCETDVANTYLMFCRFQLMRGVWTPQHHERETALLRKRLTALAGDGAGHWREFVDAWRNA
ncbi:MAG: 3'-5' exonuclease [Burkholderiaceae bacterium]|nr:3'-5' exonuclease [Burkholderiaceae bacterium]MEB2350950.1 3'-5' exonuclease [Burkholderiaceae bacterium]